jgi:hypothetical protein
MRAPAWALLGLLACGGAPPSERTSPRDRAVEPAPPTTVEVARRRDVAVEAEVPVRAEAALSEEEMAAEADALVAEVAEMEPCEGAAGDLARLRGAMHEQRQRLEEAGPAERRWHVFGLLVTTADEARRLNCRGDSE